MTLKRNILIIVVLGIIPFLIGYNNGASVIYGLLLEKIGLNNFQIELFKSVYLIGLAIGGLIGGIAVDKWDRKKQLVIIILITSFVSVVIQIFSRYEILLIHRFLLGFSLGFLTLSIQVQIVEFSIIKHRGKFLIIFLLCMILGNLTYSLVSNYFLPENLRQTLNYEHLQIPFIIFPLITLTVIKMIPSHSPIISTKETNVKILFRPKYRLVLITMIVLSIITAFANSSSYLYKGGTIIMDNNVTFLPLLLGLFGTLIGFFIIDSLGRKKLLIYGGTLLIISSLLNTIILNFITDSTIIIILISIYILFFSFTFNTTLPLIILEYVPTNIRGRGMIIYHIISWFPNILYSSFFMSLIVKKGGDFILVSGVMLVTLSLGYIYINKRLIETKEKSLENIRLEIVDN